MYSIWKSGDEVESELLCEESILNEENFHEFVRPYRDALHNMKLRIETFNLDFRHNYKDYPIHNVQDRIKARLSIEQKLKNMSLPVSVESARDSLTDIAGIRIICYFEKDVYAVSSLLKKQSDLIIIKEIDYIRKPKENGYRSYHIVFGVPLYYTDGMDYYPVEVQIRTLSMDLWASMDHRICYKSGYSGNLAEYAQELKKMEKSMADLFDKINQNE